MKKKMMIFLSFIMILGKTITYVQATEPKDTGIITYELAGGYNSILNPEIIREDLPIILHSPRKEGYSFGGWYEDDAYEQRIYSINKKKDYTLYAKWNLDIDSNRNVQDYTYNDNGTDLLLKELSYDFLYAIDTPGNPKTRIADLLEDKFSSEYQCPQGFCITEDYYIVSSYALENNKLGALTLYDRNTGEYIVSLGMEASSHLGGVAFDGENIWICHSNTKEIECISYEFIKSIASVSEQNFVDISNCFQKFKVKNIPSCIACYKNKIYIATHKIYSPGTMYCYEFSDNSLIYKEKYWVPAQVQGVNIAEDGSVWISQSYGRNRSSHLLIYKSLLDLKKEFLVPLYAVEMPPGSEAVYTTGEVCYLIFETASYKYYEGSDGDGICRYPIDKILMINRNSIKYD